MWHGSQHIQGFTRFYLIGGSPCAWWWSKKQETRLFIAFSTTWMVTFQRRRQLCFIWKYPPPIYFYIKFGKKMSFFHVQEALNPGLILRSTKMWPHRTVFPSPAPGSYSWPFFLLKVAINFLDQFFKNISLCTAVQCSVQYSKVQYSRVQYSTVQYSTVQCTVLHCNAQKLSRHHPQHASQIGIVLLSTA